MMMHPPALTSEQTEDMVFPWWTSDFRLMTSHLSSFPAHFIRRRDCLVRICIFGASGTALDEIYIRETEALGKRLASRGHSLIFGGGKHGLMGAAARGFTEGGGPIVGVAPTFFKDKGVIYDRCDEFVWPDSMRDRKKYMEDNADAFIVVPGGIGTYEEFFEVLTLKQLARMSKPIAVFNINGYFDPLMTMIGDNIKDGFVRPQTRELFRLCATVEEAVECVENDTYDIEKIRFAD